ncbi:MAG: trigger factor [Polyangiaceae bacterium]|nr:trigger factor [Polyangiaceae bacterium]
MQVSVQRISPVVLELQVEVPATHVKAEIDKAYTHLGRTARIKGFRPGKAPRDVLSRMFATQVTNDVANAIVKDTLPKALQEKNLTPVNQPSVQANKGVNPRESFSFKARFEVQPDIDDVKFEGFELYRPKIEVGEEAVEVQLENLRQRSAPLKAPEPPRGAQKGDVLSMDFVLSIDGKEIKDGGAQGIQIELGSGQALGAIEEALVDQNVGAKVEAVHTFQADHPREDFRNKTGCFAITITDLKERVPPAIDDEFAKDIGFDTLVALRADIHTKLEKAMKDRAENALTEQIVQKLNDLNPCDVPPSLVEQQSRMMEQEIMGNARRMGQQISREQADNLRNAIKVDAERKVRAGLLMAAIAKKHEFRITDRDVENGLAELAAETGKNVAKLRAQYNEKGKREMLIGMILEDKILNFIETKSTIIDGEPPSESPAPKSGEEAETVEEGGA